MAERSSCAVSKRKLAGVHNIGAKSWKTTSRAFGGHIDSSILRKVMLQSALVKSKEKTLEQVDLSIRKFVQQMVERA